MGVSIREPFDFIYKPIQWLFFAMIIAAPLALLASPYYKYSILPALFLIFLFILIRKLELAFYALIFIIPYNAFTAVAGSYQILTISRVFGFWIVLFVLFYVLISKKTTFNVQPAFWLTLAFFFLISLISALVSPYPLTSFDNLRMMVVPYVYIALVIYFINKNGFIRTLPLVLVASISLSALLTIGGYVLDLPLFLSNGSSVMKRASGTMVDPNEYASLIIFNIPMLAALFFTARKLLSKLLLIGLFSILLTAIIVTYSRGGALATAIISLLIAIEYRNRFKPKFMGIVLLLLLIALAITLSVVPSTYWQRQRSMTNTADASIAGRLSHIKVSWDFFKDHPILGSGPGTYYEAYAHTPEARYYKQRKRVAHNAYLEVLIGTGMAGFLAFLAIIGLTFRNFSSSKKAFLLAGDTTMASFISAYRLSFISFLIYFFLLSSQYDKYFWMAIATSQLALIYSRNIPEKP